MSRARFQLSITARSNEHPFSVVYDPYPPDRFNEDEAGARQWAEGMREGLYDYNVTLLKDGAAAPESGDGR